MNTKEPTNTYKNQSLLHRLKFAFRGIYVVVKRESSLKIHFVAAEMLFIFCLFVRPSLQWCAIFSICVAGVISFELLNSALEYFLDEHFPEFNVNIGLVKDILAAAVLIWSLASLFVFLLFIIDKF